MITKKETWTEYTEAWSTKDTDARMALLEKHLTPACTYSDPNASIAGHAEISTYMAGFQAQVENGRFELGEFIEHTRYSIAFWTLLDRDGNEVYPGKSFGEYDDQNRLIRMVGFF